MESDYRKIYDIEKDKNGSIQLLDDGLFYPK